MYNIYILILLMNRYHRDRRSYVSTECDNTASRCVQLETDFEFWIASKNPNLFSATS